MPAQCLPNVPQLPRLLPLPRVNRVRSGGGCGILVLAASTARAVQVRRKHESLCAVCADAAVEVRHHSVYPCDSLDFPIEKSFLLLAQRAVRVWLRAICVYLEAFEYTHTQSLLRNNCHLENNSILKLLRHKFQNLEEVCYTN